MSGVTKPAAAGDVISPTMAARMARLGAAAAWTEEPAKRVAEAVMGAQPDVLSDLAETVDAVNAKAAEPKAPETPQDAPKGETDAVALSEPQKPAVELLVASASVLNAEPETTIPEKQDSGVVDIDQSSIGREAFSPAVHVIDSVQVAALRISGSGIDRSEEEAANLTPPPAPVAAPAPPPVDPVAALAQSLSPEVLAQLAQFAASKVAAAQPGADAAAADDDAEDEAEEAAPVVAEQPAAKATRRRKRQLPWEDQSSSPLTKRFTMEVPIELHNRLQFIAGTTFGSNMTYFTLEALAPVLDEELKSRGFDPEPLDMSRLLNKRGKNIHG